MFDCPLEIQRKGMQSFLIGGLAGGFFVFFWGIGVAGIFFGGWLGLGFLGFLGFLDFLEILAPSHKTDEAVSKVTDTASFGMMVL